MKRKKQTFVVPIFIHNVRKGMATNSSSTHSVIYKNKDEMLEDLNIFEVDYYDRWTNTIAATREAKIKYILANIKYNLRLVQIMSELYPEMKQYFPLIKKDIENTKNDEWSEPLFGMYCRGDLYFEDDEHVSVEYLRKIIDNDDIAIVGGSDEMDFVFDTIEGHECLPGANSFIYDKNYKRRGLRSNGNYCIAFMDRYDGDGPMKIRFTFAGDEPVPEYPELIDLRITNRCDNGCPFCFMDSKMSEKDADFNFLVHSVFRNVPEGTEFSLGGGNVLLHPQFRDIVKEMKKRKLICNITIHAKDVKKLENDMDLAKFIYVNVDGIGLSITSMDDVPAFENLKKLFDKIVKESSHDELKTFLGYPVDYYNEFSAPWVCIHLIPEMLGADKTIEIIEASRKNHYVDFLFLGYKNVGRGKNIKSCKFTESELKKIFSHFDGYRSISIDTSFANTYKDYLDSNFYTRQCIEHNEGQWSMYIDGVTKNAYKSSYETENPKPLNPYYENVKSVFGKIREDCGFKSYDGFEFLQ